MSNIIKIKKGLNLRLLGEAKGEASAIGRTSGDFALFPDDYCGITPKISKKEGEHVTAGETIIYDKWHNDLSIASPISGIISKITRGDRRKIMRIEIKADNEPQAPFKFDVSDLNPDKITKILQHSGLWVHMRQRPYDIVPDPGKPARDIFITTFDSSPLAVAQPLSGNRASLFCKGVEILSKLTKGTVYIGCRNDNYIETPNSTSYIIEGPHPAGNAGVQIEAIKPVNKNEVVWTVDAETVIRIGGLFTTGQVDWTTTVAITGECVKKPAILKAVVGIALKDLISGNLTEDPNACRIISGNVLTGVHEVLEGYLHHPFRQITVIPENAHTDEFMGWASLSPRKFSFSHCFWSWLESKSKRYHFDAKINGAERAIIMAGEYDKVFPMDIYSEFLIKAILAKDIDKMEQLGIYEVAPEDFALCEFIDTSKLELQKIVREGLDFLRKEMN